MPCVAVAVLATQPHGPPLGRRRGRQRRSAGPLCFTHAASLLAALLLAAGLPSPAAANRAEGHDCPQYGGTILDLPEMPDCRRLLSKLSSSDCLPNYHVAVIDEHPGETCCKHAASFFALQCHCWSSQFDHAAVAGVSAVDGACTPHAKQQAQQQQGAKGGMAAAGGTIQLSRLREQAGGGSTQQQQQQQEAAGAAASAGAGAGISLFVGVLSAGARREARDAIRATWGAHPGAHRLRFFLARPASDSLFEEVRQEAVEKRDLVVLGHITEHYLNITHQTLEVMRAAAADPHVTHVLKVDDDSYVHMDRLLHRLQGLHKDHAFLGYIENPGGHPHRDPNNQWYVSREEWPSERYPPWAHGAGYVLTADLAAEVASGAAHASSQGGHLFKLEDIALASWVEWAAERRGFEVHLVVDKRFNYAGCNHGDLVSHYIKPAQHLCMWKQDGECKC